MKKYLTGKGDEKEMDLKRFEKTSLHFTQSKNQKSVLNYAMKPNRKSKKPTRKSYETNQKKL